MLVLLAVTQRSEAFDFSNVRERAEALSRLLYKAPSDPVPPVLAGLTWSEYDQIRFKTERALWRDGRLPFQVEFFHPGYVHRQMVTIHQITTNGAERVPAGPRFYDYGTNRLDLPEDLGHAGFRIVRSEGRFGEVAVFLGASYFRMLGKGQSYGISARGLALNTTSLDGEEFPVFREFWIQKPAARDTTISVYALMDSPSVTGAYRFVIRPGKETVAIVKAALFPRTTIKEFGLAPLTSMFLHGENGRPVFTDFRPEVHDSDGLLLQDGKGNWIWHSLEAGRMLRVNAFSDENPKGFGLLQRDRKWEHYQDPVASFERRPSVWVRPLGAWGKGHVQLAQIPSNSEFQDNVVAFWVPAETPSPGRPVLVEYELHWTREEPSSPELGRVLASRVGRVVVEPPKDPANLRFVVDFGGQALEALTNQEQLSVESSFGDGVKFVADSLYKLEANGAWRMVLEIEDPGRAVDLKARLIHRGKPVTETWTFTWQP